MSTTINWVKTHKLVLVLSAIVLYFIFTQFVRQQLGSSMRSESVSPGYGGGSLGTSSKMATNSFMADTSMPVSPEAAPMPSVTDRMVVTNTTLALLVQDVQSTMNDLKNYAQSIGGYMVDSNITRPEEGGTGSLTLRVPTAKLSEALEQFRGKAVKVVSENQSGFDVTDQYVDNDARMVILEKNKARFEQIMNEAKDVTEILRVQREIFNLQAQIDSIKGQQKYLEQTANNSLVMITLSTDELALPYAPTNAWRPAVIFKTAVRSVMGSIQSLGTFIIWLAVYAVIWLPILLIWWIVAKKRNAAKKAQLEKSTSTV